MHDHMMPPSLHVCNGLASPAGAAYRSSVHVCALLTRWADSCELRKSTTLLKL